jgi:hypothetical protein
MESIENPLYDRNAAPPSNSVEEPLADRKMQDPLYDRKAAPPSKTIEDLGFLVEK